jgi:hypothetical protein
VCDDCVMYAQTYVQLWIFSLPVLIKICMYIYICVCVYVCNGSSVLVCFLHPMEEEGGHRS